jgi:hypothetical protein
MLFVAIATGYDPGIKSQFGRDFPNPSKPFLGPTQPPIKWETDLFQGVTWPGREVDHSPST